MKKQEKEKMYGVKNNRKKRFKRRKYPRKSGKFFIQSQERMMQNQPAHAATENNAFAQINWSQNSGTLNVDSYKGQDVASIYYMSDDYDKFSLLAINRPIDERRIAKIVEMIEQGNNYLYLFPIVVTRNFEIIDGQHRYMAARITGKFIYYIFTEDFTLEDAARAVSAAKSWTIKDYIESYSERNLADYKALKELRQQHDWLPVSFTVSLCSTQGYRAAIFNHGHYKADRMKFARTFAAIAEDYRKRYDFFKTVPFLNTLTNLTANSDYNHGRMLKKLDLVPTKLKRCATVESYLELMTEIYNYRTSPENRVFFIDRYRRLSKRDE